MFSLAYRWQYMLAFFNLSGSAFSLVATPTSSTNKGEGLSVLEKEVGFVRRKREVGLPTRVNLGQRRRQGLPVHPH